MNTELSNMTLESLGILTGIEGYRAALADPPNWQARLDGESQWLDYEDRLDNCWSVWDARMIAHDSVVQWRRKPEVKRDPMRYVVRPTELHDDIIVGEPNGHFVDVNLRLPFAWSSKVARVTVEEIVDKPASIPLQPAEAVREQTEVVLIDKEWLGKRVRVVVEAPDSCATPVNETLRASAVWQYGFDSCQEWLDPPDGRLGGAIPKNPYTGDELCLQAEAVTDGADRIMKKLSGAGTANGWTNAFIAEVVGLEQQLASALGSQKAAVAALEVERMHGCWLRNALEMCAKYFGSASVDDLRQHIAKTLRDIDETAGKESGG